MGTLPSDVAWLCVCRRNGIVKKLPFGFAKKKSDAPGEKPWILW